MESNDTLEKGLTDREDKESRESKKWKNVFIVMIIISLLLIAAVVVLAVKGNFKKNKKEEEEEELDDDEKFLRNWRPLGDRIKTTWGENLDPHHVWEEYPRPQMERKEWTNLNGAWEYWIKPKGFPYFPTDKPERILVPYPIESSLSGVMKTLNENQELWYRKKIKVKDEWRKNNHLILHFGAVDWKAEVFVNGIKVGEHIGGYTPFFFDIIDYIDLTKDEFDVILKVFDPTDKSFQPRGKQTLSPSGIWYTCTSGIWQTVWLESLGDNYIHNITINSDFDNRGIKMFLRLNTEDELPLSISVYYNNTKILTTDDERGNTNITLTIDEANFHPWSPKEPNLYDIEITLYSDEEKKNKADFVKTYHGIRKITKERDDKNILRFKLNNKFFFSMGPLDQGFW